ncbi:MAG: aldo/keto reductase [Candidatus Nanopelagicales bacterium]|nr:aldo/keto reductase [Candidatus Nanopelagicales bacterium]
MAILGNTTLDVFPLCLGGNVFGWTADREATFEILDAYAAAGGNFIDTADVYSEWLPGHIGGESETLIGEWMKDRGNRDHMTIATKVSSLTTRPGLSPENIRIATEECLTRLQTDRIDLLYAHRDDPSTPIIDTLNAFDALVHSGKVRYLGASNFTPDRLQESVATSASNGLTQYSVLQNNYNLINRAEYETSMRDIAAQSGITHVPYYGLARGFLTGKYRPGISVESVRASNAEKLLDDRGLQILAALDDVAAQHQVPLATVALSWLKAQPTIGAPIASARTLDQLKELLPMANFDLSDDELTRLSAVSSI